MKDGELKEMEPEVFKQFLRSRSRKPSPIKRPRLQGLEEDSGIIVAAEMSWGDEAGDEVGDRVGDDWKEGEERQLYGADNNLYLYHRGRKRSRTATPLDHDYTPTTSSREKKKRIKCSPAVRHSMLPHPLAL